jgi:hypothetical protein
VSEKDKQHHYNIPVICFSYKMVFQVENEGQEAFYQVAQASTITRKEEMAP